MKSVFLAAGPVRGGMKRALLGAMVLAVVGGAASAQVSLSVSTPAYNYYNRPGADLATHERELLDCVGRASRTFRNSRMGADFNVENCMVSKGWRVALVDVATAKRLMKTPWEEVASSFLAARVGEAEPKLGIARQWDNDAARSSTIRDGLRPDYDGKPSISLKGIDPRKVAQVERDNFAPQFHDIRPPPREVGRALSAKQIAGLPTDAAVVLLRIKNPSPKTGVGLGLERTTGDPPVNAGPVDGKVARFGAMPTTLGHRKEGWMVAVAVPPGTWRMENLIVGQVIDFCVGSPAFEVKPGETIFAGTFDLSADLLKPEMDLADARTMLASRPERAEALKPAVWRNGSTSHCRVGMIYALEFEDAPFIEGTRSAGAAAPTP
jgi:hypothetical protein